MSIKLKVLLRKSLFLFTPLLFALAPVLFLYAKNIQEVQLDLLYAPLLVVVVASLLLSLISKLIIKDSNKTSLAVSLFWVFFFSYGYVFGYLDKILPDTLGRHRYLLSTWGIVFVFLLILLVRSKKNTKNLLGSTIIAGIVIVSMQIPSIVQHTAGAVESGSFEYLVNDEERKLDSSKVSDLPNIYYIMLDGYPRSDILNDYFGFSNHEFDNFLESKNFYLATKSNSNYNQTNLSIPSTMNMSYLKDSDQLKEIGREPLSVNTTIDLYHNNRALHYLKGGGGYNFINNSSLFSAKYNPVADFNVSCAKNNEFSNELIALTAIKPFNAVTNQVRKDVRADALCTISNIDGGSNILGEPKFVFTHILPPHPPYIFGEDGEDVLREANLSLTVADRWLAKEPFIAQLKYLNKRIRTTVDQILSKSPNSIIIIQSDHGTLSSATERVALLDTRPIVLKERSSIYTAIHLPEFCNRNVLNESMTSVNTFRIIFNSCFDAGYPILEDKIYYDTEGPSRYQYFEDITNIVR